MTSTEEEFCFVMACGSTVLFVNEEEAAATVTIAGDTAARGKPKSYALPFYLMTNKENPSSLLYFHDHSPNVTNQLPCLSG